MERRPPQPNRTSPTPPALTNAEDEFVEFMASLGPPRAVAEATRTPAPAPQPQATGLGHLDALCRLMEQLSSLRQQNCRLQRRVNHLERLQCVHALDRSASGDSLLATSHPRRGRSRSADGGAAWDAASCEDLPAHLVAFGRRISGDGVSDSPAPRSTSPTVEDGAKSRSLDRTKVAKGMYTSSRLQSQGSGKRSSSAWGRVKTIIQTRRDSLRRRCLSPPLEEECKETEVADRVEDASKWQKVKRVFCSKRGQSQQSQQQPAPLQRSQSVPSSPTAHTIFSYEDLDLLPGGLMEEGSSSRLSDDAQRHLAHLQRNLSHDFSLKMEEWGRIQQERKMSKDVVSTQEELRRKRNSTDGFLMRASASECAALQRGRSRSDTSLAEAAPGEDTCRATSQPELVLAAGSASLDRLRVHEQVCQQLQGQLNDLDQHLHEMISVHAKELAKYKSQMAKQCGSAELPAFSTLEEHLRHVETAQQRLERTRHTKPTQETALESQPTLSQGEDNASLVHPLDPSQLRGSAGSSPGGHFGGSASPRQARATADIDVAKIQELSEALALQAQQLEDALKERNAAVRQLRWELLATDVQALRARVRKPRSPRPEPSSTKRGWTSLEGVGSLFPSKDEEDVPEEEKDPTQRLQEEAFAQELRATVHEMQAGLNVEVSEPDIAVFPSNLDDQQFSIRVDAPVRLPLKQEKAASTEAPADNNLPDVGGGGGGRVRARRMSDTSVPYDPRAPPQANDSPGLPWDDLPTRVKLDFASAFSTAIYDDEALQQPIGLFSSPPKRAPASPSSDSDSDDSGVTFTLSPARPTAPHPQPAEAPTPPATSKPHPPPPPPTPPPRSPLPPRPPSNVRRMIARFTTPPPSPPCPQRALSKSSTYSNPPPSPTQERIAKSATVASVVQGPPPRSPCPRPSRLPRAQNSPSSPRLPQPPSRQIAAVSPVVMRRRVPEATHRVPTDEAKSSFFSFRLCRPRSKRRDSDSGVNSPLEILCRQSLLLDIPHPNPNSNPNSPTQTPTTTTSSSPCPSSPPPPAPKPKGGWPVKLFRPK